MARKISIAKTKTTTAKETIYTVPVKNSGLWSVLYVISTAGTNTPSVYWYDASATLASGVETEYLVLSGKNLGTGEFLLLNQAEVVLQEGDEIRISQSGTSSVTYICTVELVPSLATQFHGG